MNYDAIIIGFGKGGKTLAGSLAKKGMNVALVEKSQKMYGGTCINIGCIPSKSLVNSGKYISHANLATFVEKSQAYKAAILEKRRVTGMLREKNYQKLNNLERVTIYLGEASFLSEHTINVKTAEGSLILEGTNIFINTGSTPVIPDIPGIEGNPFVYTSETLMELEVLPKRLVIIGGGYISLEFASMYAAFGSQVTILQNGSVFLPREDSDLSEEIFKVLTAKGVTIITDATEISLNRQQTSSTITYKHEGIIKVLEAETTLIATGRRPNTESLNLEAAHIETTNRGAIKVDAYLRTSVDKVWALGDVNGGLQFTYISLDDYRIVLPQVDGEPVKDLSSRNHVPYSVFLSPSFSRVGLIEKEALEAGYHIKVGKLPAAMIPKAQVLQSTDGLLKVIIDADTHKILGAMLFCEESYEMINLIKLAMDAGVNYQILRDQIYTHPTMSEAFNDLFGLI